MPAVSSGRPGSIFFSWLSGLASCYLWISESIRLSVQAEDEVTRGDERMFMDSAETPSSSQSQGVSQVQLRLCCADV